MGRTLQVTILFGFVAASWFLISNSDKTYFGLNLNLFPIAYLGLIAMLLLSVLSLIILALSEIPILNPKHKSKLLGFYDYLYTYGIVYLIAAVAIQIWLWISNLLSDFLANKVNKTWWQIILSAIVVMFIIYLSKKYKFFKKR